MLLLNVTLNKNITKNLPEAFISHWRRSSRWGLVAVPGLVVGPRCWPMGLQPQHTDSDAGKVVTAPIFVQMNLHQRVKQLFTDRHFFIY